MNTILYSLIAFANKEWISNSFANGILKTWPITKSNHAPLILDNHRLSTFRKDEHVFDKLEAIIKDQTVGVYALKFNLLAYRK